MEYVDVFGLDGVQPHSSTLSRGVFDPFDAFPVKLSAQLMSEIESPHHHLRRNCSWLRQTTMLGSGTCLKRS
jgi:hypothetical protein